MHTGFVRAAISLCEIVLLSCLNATQQSVLRRQLQPVQPFMLRDPRASWVIECVSEVSAAPPLLLQAFCICWLCVCVTCGAPSLNTLITASGFNSTASLYAICTLLRARFHHVCTGGAQASPHLLENREGRADVVCIFFLLRGAQGTAASLTSN